jgi:phage shock protein A
MSEVSLAMQRAQDKILTTQARANALQTLLDRGELGDQALLGPGDALDRELQQLSTEQNVEAQLQALKQQLQIGGPNVQQRQLPPP